VLLALGLNISDAVRFFKQVTLKQSLPFPLTLPNKTTRKALKELNEQAPSYKSLQAMLDDENAV